MNRKLERIKPSVTMSFISKAKEMQKKDPSVINLAGGEPDFATPDKISIATIRSLTEGNTHYNICPGVPALREAIFQKLTKENGIICDKNNILVTAGGKNAIYLAVNAIIDDGDEVLLLDPAYVSYEPIVITAGGIPKRIKLRIEDDYRINADQLESAYSDKTKLLIINYPNNPTGRILHSDEADVLEAFLLHHPDVILLSDEVYERIVFDNNRSISMGSRASVSDRIVTINGFSKSVAMTGWRLGYMVSNKTIFDGAYKLYQHSLTCVNGFVQVGAVEAFNCSYEIEEMRKQYEERRNAFIGTLNSIPGVSCSIPEGAFYAWVKFDIPGLGTDNICNYLLEHAGVVGTPGIGFDDTAINYVRFSFANSMEKLMDAAERIKKVLIS